MKVCALVAFGVGYVAGARAGRDRYHQIARGTERIAEGLERYARGGDASGGGEAAGPERHRTGPARGGGTRERSTGPAPPGVELRSTSWRGPDRPPDDGGGGSDDVDASDVAEDLDAFERIASVGVLLGPTHRS